MASRRRSAAAVGGHLTLSHRELRLHWWQGSRFWWRRRLPRDFVMLALLQQGLAAVVLALW